MERRETAEAYAASPVGAWFGGGGILHAFVAPDLAVTLLWGRPDAEAVRRFTSAVVAELPERSALHDALVDARGLAGVDPDAFAVLSTFVGQRAAAFAANVRRQAIVRPSGLVGALVAGFYDVTPAAAPERTRVLSDPAEALAWLGRTDRARVLARLERLSGEASGRPAPVRALRAHLAEHPRARLGDAALALGVPARALQEALRRAGTSFRREAIEARIDAARVALAGTDRKLSVLALELGFASVQHLSAQFRRATGLTPTAWRARHRAPAPEPT